jgi:phospholipase C
MAASSLSKIEHVVVLMLENRSFDNVLGRLYPKSDLFDGLSGAESNPGPDGQPVLVNNISGATTESQSIPDPDPGELWTDMNEQIFGTPTPLPSSVPTMGGFVKNYQSQTHRPANEYDPKQIMHYFTPEQVPVISQLARQFAVCDRWFASAPCQTWPNRFFLHTGTANGFENNSPPHFPYTMPTIFNRFDDAGIKNGWKVYFDGIPQTLALSKLWRSIRRFERYDRGFLKDAKAGTLPAYAFIEPKYFPVRAMPSDQHPPGDITSGEQLIAEVYNALRNGPKWKSTLLIIIYDEHGGCYDHVAPPAAASPGPLPSAPFNFDRYGVRVPAVIVSPFVKQGTVLRPPAATPYDHTSVIATLRKRFDLGGPLTNRDASAPTLEGALSLEAPDNMGPDHLEALQVETLSIRLERERRRPMNDLQKSLLRLSALLPRNANDGEKQTKRLRAAPNTQAVETDVPAGEAGEIAERRARRLFDTANRADPDVPHAFTATSFIVMLGVGAIAGSLALLVLGGPWGLLGYMIAGIIGSLAGGWLLGRSKINRKYPLIGQIVAAAIGALIGIGVLAIGT